MGNENTLFQRSHHFADFPVLESQGSPQESAVLTGEPRLFRMFGAVDVEFDELKEALTRVHSSDLVTEKFIKDDRNRICENTRD